MNREETMNRNEALTVIADQAEKAAAFVFAGNGFNARALCALKDRPQFFYMVGSMGLCPTLAAGLARCVSNPVVAIEGDGNALMGLSGYPVSAAAAAGTFVHVVLDNSLYETTGGQRTLADRVDLLAIAAASGYPRAVMCKEPDALERGVAEALRFQSATFVYVPTETTPGPPHPRVPYHPREIAVRFRECATDAPADDPTEGAS